MSDENIKFGKDGKPTKESMEYLFRTDRDKFLEYQDEYFTTKAKMKDNPLKGVLKNVMKKKESK
jgi:hypothetical protein